MLYLLLLILPAYSYAFVIEQEGKLPASHSYEYEFYDLAIADVPLEQLSKYHLPNTLAPRINDRRELVYNQVNQSIALNLAGDSLAPHMPMSRSHCSGLNNSGRLLLSFEHTPADVLWAMWQQEGMRPKHKISIDKNGLAGRNIFLRNLNAQNMAVGSFKPSGALRPLIWQADVGLHHLGSYLGRDIQGVAWDVNDQGTVVGSELVDGHAIPFVWHAKGGLQRLDGFRGIWEKMMGSTLDGHIHFGDALIAENNLFYGTFYLTKEERQTSPHYAFWWNAKSAEVRPLDLKGMRLNAVAQNTFVGQWHGLAALCDLGRAPILLTELLTSVPTGWELLNATDINQHGDIVGYGQKDGSMRYFALKRGKMKNVP